MIGQARSLLAVIAEEVTNRDNKTCLLLPRKNFGREIDRVFDCVRDQVKVMSRDHMIAAHWNFRC